MTDLAAAFMRSKAFLSFGFSKPYLLANLKAQEFRHGNAVGNTSSGC